MENITEKPVSRNLAEHLVDDVPTNTDDPKAKIPIDGLKIGLSFDSEDEAVTEILNWANQTFCPLSKYRREKNMAETEGTQKGRRTFRCPHGVKRKLKSEVRKNQNVKFSRCPVQINLNEQSDGTYMITSFMLEHSGIV